MQMSRWDDEYSEFQAMWEQVRESALSVQIVKDMDAEQHSEIARFKRVIEYVDNVQKSGVKDVMPLTTIEEATEKSESLRDHIDEWNNSFDLEDLTLANDTLDELLLLICPFVMNSKESAQAVGHAFSAYSKVINESTQELRTSSKKLVDTFEGWHTDISKKHTDIITKNNEIEEAHNLILVDDEEGASRKTSVNIFYNKIKSFYEELLEEVIDEENEENNKPSIKDKINLAKDTVLENLETVKEETAELQVFHEKIFGTKIEEGERAGEREGGLKQEIDDLQNQLNEYKNEQQDIIKKLQERIEGLLPGATSAGLATAFRDLKLESEGAVKRYTYYFYCSLGGLFVAALFSLFSEFCYIFPFVNSCNITVSGDFFYLWGRSLLAKSLFIVPTLWFAIFTNKRRSEHQRLQQEYAHKESVSKSFEGYKREIEGLGLVDERLLVELLETAIKVIGYNASVTLAGKHGEGPPITEAVRAAGLGKNSS